MMNCCLLSTSAAQSATTPLKWPPPSGSLHAQYRRAAVATDHGGWFCKKCKVEFNLGSPNQSWLRKPPFWLKNRGYRAGTNKENNMNSRSKLGFSLHVGLRMWGADLRGRKILNIHSRTMGLIREPFKIHLCVIRRIGKVPHFSTPRAGP